MGNTTNKPIERYDLSETPKSIFGLKSGPDDNYDSETKMTCSDLSMFNSRYRTYVFDAKEAYCSLTDSDDLDHALSFIPPVQVGRKRPDLDGTSP